MRLTAAATLLVATVAGLGAGPAQAMITTRVVPLPQQQVRPAAAARPLWHAHGTGPHVFYGTIAAMSGPMLQIRLRNGRLVPVDATTAIANGDYSAPLYVGKVVSVDGSESGGKYTAAHVFRMTNLADLRADK